MLTELSIIIPTLNERENIVLLVEKLRKSLKGINWEVIFVDDDSKDGTADVIEAISQKDNRIHLLKRIKRLGLSSACIEGMNKSQASYMAVMDADMQHDEMLLKKMLAVLKNEGLDLVIGSRYILDRGVGGWSKIRVFMSWFATFLTRLVLRHNIKDPLSGFFMIKRDFFKRNSVFLYGSGQKILLDICLFTPESFTFKELPYQFRKRSVGKSKLGVRVIVENILLLLYAFKVKNIVKRN